MFWKHSLSFELNQSTFCWRFTTINNNSASGVQSLTTTGTSGAASLTGTTLNIPTPPTINDQASSGYVDIGTTRIQWGKSTPPSGAAGSTVTLPASFADTDYVVQLTPILVGSNSANVSCRVTQINSVSGFDWATTYNSSLWASNIPVYWTAIGLKP